MAQRDGLDVENRMVRVLLVQAQQRSRTSGHRDRVTSTVAEPWTASDSDTETLADVDAEPPEWTEAEWGMYVDIEVLEGVEVEGLESDEEA
jgi:hypothetical protein